jgi:hypothetical protein
MPNANLKLSRQNGIVFVWCVLRRKKLVLTPEEWVRQHCIHYLIDFKGISSNKIASEMGITVQGQQRRCDLVVFNDEHAPEILVECKAPEVVLTDKVVDQIIQYNSIIKVKFLWVTNGLVHYFLNFDTTKNSWVRNETF